jgi:hypothetical protein
MANVNAIRDDNHVPVALGVQSTDSTATYPFTINPITGRLLTDNAGGGGGTVTSVSVTSANGFAGTVATATTTPAITISTTINAPVLAGNGTAISAATTVGTGSTVVLQTSPTLITPVLGVATATSINGLTLTSSTGTFTLTNAKVFTVSNTLTLTSNDGATLAIGGGGTLGSNAYTSTAYAPINSPTFTGTVTIPTPFTIGAVSMTATGTQLNYLAAATGTTGTTSTNVVFSTSPTLVTPVLGVASATSINKLTITTPASGSTLTIIDGKTLTINKTISFTAADDTGVYTLPTGTKTLAANDGSNWTFGSQAIGDLVYASSTTAFTRLAAVAVGQVLVSAGTGTAPAYSANPQVTTIELGAATDTTLARVSAGVISVEGVTVPTISSTSTITNKRNQPRITSAASYTTDTGTSLDVSTTDIFVITAQAGALLFNAPGGTPVQGEKLMIRIKDNGTARALTYNAIFRASSDLALPTTTVLSKTLYMGFIYKPQILNGSASCTK